MIEQGQVYRALYRPCHVYLVVARAITGYDSLWYVRSLGCDPDDGTSFMMPLPMLTAGLLSQADTYERIA